MRLPYICMVNESHDLSPTQSKVYRLLKDHIQKEGVMPTFREIAKAMGWKAVGSVQTAVKALIEKGWLEKEPGKSRGLRLTQPNTLRYVPVLGSAPAGPPLEAIESHEEDIAVPQFLRGPVFAVRVQGDSMQEAGINDEDLVIVREAKQAEHGEIIVAMIEGEVTIKRFVKRKDGFYLKPENTKYSIRKIDNPTFRVLGKVIGLHRYF